MKPIKIPFKTTTKSGKKKLKKLGLFSTEKSHNNLEENSQNILQTILEKPSKNSLKIFTQKMALKCDKILQKKMAKKCIGCNKHITLNNFYKQSSDGFQSKCKDCFKNNVKSYQKTKEGLITKIYANQLKNSKKRGHNKPSYSKDELRQWLYTQSEFHKMYYHYKKSDFDKDFIPSVDRVNKNKGYAICNIQLLTWEEHKRKSVDEMLNHKKIAKYDMEWNLLTTYNNIFEVPNPNNVLLCCTDELTSTNGNRWSFI